jgi:hypothetical protein
MWGAGFATGIGVGFALGLIVGSLVIKQKPWSKLSKKEKKFRIGLVGLGIVLFVISISIFLTR